MCLHCFVFGYISVRLLVSANFPDVTKKGKGNLLCLALGQTWEMLSKQAWETWRKDITCCLSLFKGKWPNLECQSLAILLTKEATAADKE